MSDVDNRPSTWRVVLAAIFDFLTIFILGGWLIAALTGGLTGHGFALNGWPALLLFVLIIAYFVVGNRIGGTLWKRILRAR
ncbi:hypothetical protein [Rhizobium halophytocola]|uniref:RDD family protein n=1 Tax=Rhizobium halophytocola TaxID=735519 RepID=A0ABS4DWQ7_9HYPH|nr:hypothetical protein [Rhizobium halophytocola]MBP1850107.1 hypothetical protein [Rhizobium halophytocola]